MTIKKLLLLFFTIVLGMTIYYYSKSNNDFFKNSISVNIPENNDQEPDHLSVKIINEAKDYKLPIGEQIYEINHGELVEGPRAQRISYNPLAIEPGETQTITVSFPDTENVSSGVIFITTDNLENQKVTLKKTSDKTANVWEGAWTPGDTIRKRYNIRLYFIGQSGTYNSLVNFI